MSKANPNPIAAHARARITAAVAIASFTKVYFSYIAKFISATDPALHLSLRRAFGDIVWYSAKWLGTAADMAELRRVTSASGAAQSDREPLELVANILPDGTMDAELTPKHILEWVAISERDVAVRKWPVLPVAVTPNEVLAAGADLYDDLARIDAALHVVAHGVLESSKYVFALRNESLAETEKSFTAKMVSWRAKYHEYVKEALDPEPIVTMAKVDANPAAAMGFLRTLVDTSSMGGNVFVIAVIRKIGRAHV